jgi:periplasmic divalent cation tolerance protein
MEKSDRPIETAADPMCVAIMSTAPDILLAKRIAHVLVEEKLAACVQLSPPALSVYEWQGEVHGDEEIGMVIKTSRSAARQAIERLLEMHPYEVPEAIVVPIVGGHFDYLNWVCQQTQP